MPNKDQKHVVIIGAGPAGLTAAYELAKHGGYRISVYEATDGVGGISRTFKYKGNYIDIGGHRFFSKSDRVMEWWTTILPIQKTGTDDVQISYHHKATTVPTGDGPDPDLVDNVMLVRSRLSRIRYLRKFFSYPVSLSVSTIKNLGLVRTLKIGLSYIRVRLFPVRREENLEDFFINRFGRELYHTFFKSYTVKVWGIPVHEISSEWGKQRIKGLSITAALKDALKKLYKKDTSLSQKDTETSLIEQFLYPKYGPGHMWEEVKRRVESYGANVFLNHRVTYFTFDAGVLAGVNVQKPDGTKDTIIADYIISTMPVSQLVQGMGAVAPPKVREIASGLKYRAFVTVGVLLRDLKVKAEDGVSLIPDNWIYIQEHDVHVGRIQVFNNWSPYLVKDPDNTVWLGLEYFCNEGDELWSKSDDDMVAFALDELEHIGFCSKEDFLDAVVIRVPKTYPTYFGSYDQFALVREFVDTIPNLFLVGRNGMHRYNNQDHSMLTAMAAVENIISGRTDKSNIWEVNTEQEYHEEK